MVALIALAPDQRRSRAFLQDMLWTDASPEKGGQNFRRTLSDLRQQLGDGFDVVFRTTREEIAARDGALVVTGGRHDGDLLEGIDINEEGFEAWLTRERQSEPPPLVARDPRLLRENLNPSIAVIPFRMAYGGVGQEPFGDAVAEELTRVMSKSSFLNVTSHLSCRSFAARGLETADIVTRLNVEYAVTGTFHVEGDKAELCVDLHETGGDLQLSSERYVVRIPDFFRAGDGVLADISRQIRDTIFAFEVNAAAARPLPDIDTHRLMIAGVSLFHRTTWQSFRRAKDALEEISARAPRHSIVHAWLAKWHVFKIWQGWSDDHAADVAAAEARIAAALDANPDCAFSLCVDGIVNSHLLKRPDDAEDRFNGSLERDPNHALAWLMLGALNAFRGRGAEAAEQAERANALSPLDPHNYLFQSLTATCRLAAQDWEGALVAADRSMRANRGHVSNYRVQVIALQSLGRDEEARRAAETLRRLDPGLTVRRYIETHPAAAFSVGRDWANALGQAGVPLG